MTSSSLPTVPARANDDRTITFRCFCKDDVTMPSWGDDRTVHPCGRAWRWSDADILECSEATGEPIRHDACAVRTEEIEGVPSHIHECPPCPHGYSRMHQFEINAAPEVAEAQRAQQIRALDRMSCDSHGGA